MDVNHESQIAGDEFEEINQIMDDDSNNDMFSMNAIPNVSTKTCFKIYFACYRKGDYTEAVY